MTKVLVIDFGSQYCKLIARKIRELNVYAEIFPANKKDIIEIAKDYDALVFSGGPNSVFDKTSLTIDPAIFDLNKPILGTCYGMQLIHHLLGGKVETLKKGEYGKVNLHLDVDSPIVNKVSQESIAWMSHNDSVTKLAPGFEAVASTDVCYAITQNKDKQIYTFQFHAEVNHTQFGSQLIDNFLSVVNLKRDWTIGDVLNQKVASLKKQLNGKKVILGVSGGVDSSVVAALISKASPKSLIPVFIDNGLLRKDERQKVVHAFKEYLKIDLVVVDATKDFYKALANVKDPETKRKIIGKVFIDKFSEVEKQYQSEVAFLAQGTIYPDVIESAGISGVAHVIKSHHNVGGLPKDVKFTIVEPLRDLFKDEVRKLGLELGLPAQFINRHPFPGPGLAIRIIGDISAKKVAILQEVDDIMIKFLYEHNLYHHISQAAAILTCVKTVGVQGDERTYGYLAAIRLVQTTDFMTAEIAKIDWNLLEKLSTLITNNVKEVNRVVYDITSKPPATIEWE